MVTSLDGGMAAVLRGGDYFVLKATVAGVEVEYAPDGARNGPVSGAFAAIKGVVKTWTPTEAAELVSNKGFDVENYLLRELRRSMETGIAKIKGEEPAEDLSDKIPRLLKGFAAEFNVCLGGIYRGYMPDFHREFVTAVYPGPLDARMRNVLKGLDRVLAGVWIESHGKSYKNTYFIVDWVAMAEG